MDAVARDRFGGSSRNLRQIVDSDSGSQSVDIKRKGEFKVMFTLDMRSEPDKRDLAWMAFQYDYSYLVGRYILVHTRRENHVEFLN